MSMQYTQYVLAQVTADPSTDERSLVMSIVVWLFVGLVAGFLGSKIVNKRGEGIFLDIVLGLVGAFVGGFLFSLLGIRSGGSIVFSILIATVGAILVLVVYHKLLRNSRTV